MAGNAGLEVAIAPIFRFRVVLTPSHCPAHGESHERFSVPLFLLTVAATLVVLLGLLRVGFPTVWAQQFRASFGHALAAFFIVSLLNCFLEYFFHRYFLHTAAVPLLGHLYRQHTLHHALTRIGKRRTAGGKWLSTIENIFPIVEASQGEASFFPWYTLAAFAAVLWPVLAAAQCFLPAFPWFFSGLAALASSLILYELFHAANHWPLSTWEPLIAHPRWGRLWRPAYAFHLRHHAVPDCNESISGFFGLPLADWLFRTCLIPKTIYADGEEWLPEKFASPHPRGLIRLLDRWSEESVRRRRTAARSPARPHSRGEKLGIGLAHGIGLALNLAGLTLLLFFSQTRGCDVWHIAGFAVFGLTLLGLHTVLTLDHAWRSDFGRRLTDRLRHAAGYILVAGTFTPFLLTDLRGPRGWTVFGLAWGLCGIGSVCHLVWGERFRIGRALRWLTAGWLLALVLKPMIASVPSGALGLLAAGVLCYGAAVIFAPLRRLSYHQTMRHACIMLGGLCHILAVLLFLLPAHV